MCRQAPGGRIRLPAQQPQWVACSIFFLRQVLEEERYSVDEFESVLLKDIPENGKVPCERVCDATARMILNFAVSLKHNLACILMLAGISGWDSVVF